MIPAAIALGLCIGLTLGALGGGGSVLAVPVLVYVLGESVHEATTASLVVVTAGALAGGLGHARHGHVCWRHAIAFTAAALPGVLAGTALGDAVSGPVLIAGFAAIMGVAGAAMWRRSSGPVGGEREARALCPPLRLGRDFTAGLLIGLLTGFFGVGGGFLVVPTLAVTLALAMRLAVGTSLVIITATSVLGLIAHLAAGRTIDPGVTIAMTAACVAGALAGTAVSGRLPQQALGRAFAVLVVGIAAYLLVSVAFLGGPPGSA